MLESSNWDYSFNLTYSITLSQDTLETSLVVRNTGDSNYDFQLLFHTYLAVDVSLRSSRQRYLKPSAANVPAIGHI